MKSQPASHRKCQPVGVRWMRLFAFLSSIVLVFVSVKRCNLAKMWSIQRRFRNGNPLFQLCNPLVIHLLLSFLMFSDCSANPVTATSNHKPEQRQSVALPTSATGQVERDAGECDGNAAPCSNALELLKAFFGHRWVTVVVTTIAAMVVGRMVGRIAVRKLSATSTKTYSSANVSRQP